MASATFLLLPPSPPDGGRLAASPLQARRSTLLPPSALSSQAPLGAMEGVRNVFEYRITAHIVLPSRQREIFSLVLKEKILQCHYDVLNFDDSLDKRHSTNTDQF